MKSINYNVSQVAMQNVPVGECFLYHGDLFMAVERIEDSKGKYCLCVNLVTGEITNTDFVDWDTVVTPVEVGIDVN